MAILKPGAGSAFDGIGFLAFNAFSAVLMVAILPAYLLFTGNGDWRLWAYLATFLAMSAVRSPYIKRDKPMVTRFVADKEDLVSVVVMVIGNNYIPALFIMTPLLGFADVAHPSWTLLTGVAIAALGIFVLNRAHADLAEFWSGVLEVREGHRLVKTGIYGWVRHPIYLAFILIAISQAFYFENWIAGPAGVISFMFLFYRRVPAEEQMLRDEFGDEYDAYIASTPRLIPNPLRRGKKG